jgi:hypothetical protein
VKLRPKLSLTRECEVVCLKLRPKLSLTSGSVCETASQTESDKGGEVCVKLRPKLSLTGSVKLCV